MMMMNAYIHNFKRYSTTVEYNITIRYNFKFSDWQMVTNEERTTNISSKSSQILHIMCCSIEKMSFGPLRSFLFFRK